MSCNAAHFRWIYHCLNYHDSKWELRRLFNFFIIDDFTASVGVPTWWVWGGHEMDLCNKMELYKRVIKPIQSNKQDVAVDHLQFIDVKNAKVSNGALNYTLLIMSEILRKASPMNVKISAALSHWYCWILCFVVLLCNVTLFSCWASILIKYCILQVCQSIKTHTQGLN